MNVRKLAKLAVRVPKLDRLLFTACCLLVVAPLWVTVYPPMVDLPQHAAQIAIFDRFDQAGHGYGETLTINWFTPYLFGYGLVWLLSQALPLMVALKVVISVAVLTVPLLVSAWNREIGGAAEWSYLGFPIALSYSYHWGFLNYLVAIPLVLGGLLLVLSYARKPTLRVGVGLAAGAVFLFWCHVVLAGLFCLVAGLIVAGSAPRLRDAIVRCLPLTAPLPIISLWVLWMRATEERVNQPTFWDWSAERLLELPSYIVGMHPRPLFSVAGLIVLLLPWLSGASPSRHLWRWLPLVACLSLYYVTPAGVFGTELLSPRFAVFVIPFYLLCLEPRRSPPPSLLRRNLPALFAVGWLGVALVNAIGFQLESRDFRAVLGEMEPNRKVLSLVFEPRSDHAPLPVYVHFPSWYQVKGAGFVDFSFAAYFPEIVRFIPEKSPAVGIGFEWAPHTFNWQRHHGDRYDYFMVRATDPSRTPGVLAGAPVAFVASSGSWALYRRLH